MRRRHAAMAASVLMFHGGRILIRVILHGDLMLLGRALICAEVGMVALDAGVAWQLSVTFDFARVAWIACLGLAGFAFGSNDGVDLLLRELHGIVHDVVVVDGGKGQRAARSSAHSAWMSALLTPSH